MIQIIKDSVEMPELNKRRFQKEFENNKWFVLDTEINKPVFKGKFEDVSLACYNLNKKFYRDFSKK